MSPRSSLALVVAALVACGAVLAAQTSTSQIFRVSTELVVVDLVATDRAGRFIDDLQPADIQILEDGKPQKVQFVTVVRRGTPVDPSPASSAAEAGGATPADPLPGGAIPVDSAVAPPKVAIVVDLFGMPADALPRVRAAIATLIDEDLPEGTDVMLATLGQGMAVYQPFTTSRVTLATSVQALGAPSDSPAGFTDLLEAAGKLCDDFENAPGGPEMVLRQFIALGRQIVVENQRQLALSSESLSLLARSLASEPGRKPVVLYSRGYALNPVNHVVELVAQSFGSCGGNVEMARRRAAEDLAGVGAFDPTLFEEMLDRANRSQVSFYTVDPSGLVTTSAEARQRVSARGSSRGDFQRFRALEATLPHEYLRAVADDTGGRSFLNSNDLTRGVRRAWLDANEYYLIGYAPSGAKKPGQFHRIEVKVSRPDLDLRYRRGYYAATDQDVATSDVQQALSRPDLFERDGLEIEAEVDGRLRVITYLPPHVLRFTETDALNVASVSLHAVLRDGNGRIVGGKPIFGRDIGLKLTAPQLEGLLGSDHVEIPVDVALPPPGAYRLTIVARDSGGWIGAETIDVTVER